MKIILAHNLYGVYAKGGAEKAVQRMAEDFISKGHEVVIISTEPKSDKYKKIEAEIKDETNNPRKIYIPSKYYYLHQTPKALRLFWHFNNFCNPIKLAKYKKIIKQEKPDLVISHNLVGLGFFFNRVLEKNNIRHEHFLHDIQLLHPSGLMIKNQEKKLDSLAARAYQYITKSYFKKINKIISPSSWLLEEHISRGFFENLDSEIRPLMETKREQEKRESEKNNKFIFVGQLEEHKGIIFLIQAFKKIKDDNLSLTILGSGEAEKKAKELARDDKRINFLGYLDKDQLKNEMINSDALIVPSLCYENSPTVIYEANELNLKVIAADIGGISEIIKTRDKLFEAASETELIKAIENK